MPRLSSELLEAISRRHVSVLHHQPAYRQQRPPGQAHVLCLGLWEQLMVSLALQSCSNDSLVTGRDVSWDLRFQVTLDGVFPDQSPRIQVGLRFLVIQDNPLLLFRELLGLVLNSCKVMEFQSWSM